MVSVNFKFVLIKYGVGNWKNKKQEEKIMDWKSVGNWISDTLVKVDDFVWGPVMLVLLVGTGIFLTIRLKFRPWKNLGFAIKSTLSKEARTTKRGEGDVSPFSALTTALAAMWISACFGLTSKFSECMLAIKYREVNEKGEMSGGPMYTMKKGFKNKKIGAFLGMLFAVFAVIASFGIGNMTQANSISESLKSTFNFDEKIVGVVLTVLALVIIVGGIKTISKVSSIVVPLMAIFYIIAGLIVVVMNIQNLPSGIVMIFKMAFSSQAVASGGAGVITAGVMNAMRYGVARGVFSNEAGMGSAAITASAATTDDPVRQGYINMTGTFWDTIVVCTITGLCIASSGVLGTVGDDGELVQGAALTILAFKSALGEVGAILVTIGIALFAFSTILGWEYHGEKAFEYIFGTHKYNMAYRIIFSLVVFVGATTTLQVVWNFSDIANALMAIPNLICLLVMSKVIAKEVERFQPILDKEKKAAKKKK